MIPPGWRALRTAVTWTALAALVACAGCPRKRRQHHGSSSTGVVDVKPTPDLDVTPVTGPVEPAAVAHPRIILDRATQARLRAAAKAKTPAWKRVSVECDRYLSSVAGGSYQGMQWTEAVANLSLCWYATGERKYVDRALVYARALVDDKSKVGDGLGGDDIVHSDSGYAIRSYGVYTALAYDWLHDAPGMTPELRQKMVERLRVWIPWYQEKGYLRDNPFANYFWGYFTALNLAALATAGENPDAEDWLATSRQLMTDKIIPAFGTYLRGGAWPEGWQYGELVAIELAVILEGHRTATGTNLVKRFPWVFEGVDHQLFRIRPDGKSVYDNGTHASKPVEPAAQVVTALGWLLDGVDDGRAARARFIGSHLYPKLMRKYSWAMLLAERPGAPEVDPRSPKVLSYYLPGPGLTFARSSWDANATWVSLQAGPKIAVDHQHNDQGHFEVWRGADALLVDGSDDGYATINHNSLLIYDADHVLNYPPNQGVWARESKTVRYADDGGVMVAVGDLADAWAPKCALDGCSQRAVKKAMRTLVFVRPSLVVIDDDLEVDDDQTGVVWAAHVSVPPQLAGNRASAVVGRSRVDVHALWPDGATMRAPKEPTPSKEGVYRENKPRGNMWRLETDTPKGSDSRHLLHWITVDASGAAPSTVTRIDGKGLRGGAGVVGGRSVAVLFGGDDGGSAVLTGMSGAAREVVVVGLDPGAGYQVTAAGGGDGCQLAVAKGGAKKASAGGALRIDLDGCTAR